MKTPALLWKLLAAAACAFSPALTVAQATATCQEYPKSEWRTEAELQAQLTQAGWSVRRIEASCTCYQVFGTNPDGQRVAAFFDPKTFERVEEE